MPRAEKSLRDYLKENNGPLSIDDTVQVLTDVAQALVALDGRVVHRDIKPDNILLLDGRWCLADFGISRYAEATTAPDTRKYYVTYHYAAPEQWRGERATSATDVYALGVVAYELLAGELPFAGPEDHDYMRQHLHDIPESVTGVPPGLQSLIDECLYKPAGARPRPLTLLTQLNNNVRVASDADRSLQRANALVVQERAEGIRQESVAETEAKRRAELCKVAARSLEKVVDLLDDRILSLASAIEAVDPNPHWSWSLGKARLRVEAPTTWMTDERPDDTYPAPFETIIFSTISVVVTPPEDGYEGRSHSLWYCDAHELGVFRWYETAFMKSPAVPHTEVRIAPFALEPGRNACKALAPVMVHDQVAWPFIPIDQGDEGDFIERWIGWFADGALGRLRRPIRMPEQNAEGTWRSGA